MFRSGLRSAAVVAAAALAVAACGGGGGSSPSAPDDGTIKIGILADLTGAAGAGNKTSVDGIRAGITIAEIDNNLHITFVTADAASNPTTALTAAQRLVQQDQVSVVMAYSVATFAAAPFLTAQNVPVIGVAQDGPEWITNTNMFSVIGPAHQDLVATTFALFFKQQGVTTVGSVGYGVSPNSANAAKAIGISGPEVGLEVGYLNANFPFGTTDVQPAALAIRDANVDGLQTTTTTATSFSLIKALQDLNALPKTVVLFTGYGGDLGLADPSTVDAAQGVFFPIAYEPVELDTPATRQFQDARAAVGQTGKPTYEEYFGYAGILLLIDALNAAGSDTSQANIINVLSANHSFDAGGLTGEHSFDINDRDNVVNGPNNCMWFTKLVGEDFEPVENASPLCGELLAGRRVSSS